MNYIWEFIKTIISSIFSGNNRKENREDFQIAYDSLFKLTKMLHNQIDRQEDRLDDYSKKIEELEEVKFLARKVQLELDKIRMKWVECEEAYAKCKENSKKL